MWKVQIFSNGMYQLTVDFKSEQDADDYAANLSRLSTSKWTFQTMTYGSNN